MNLKVCTGLASERLHQTGRFYFIALSLSGQGLNKNKNKFDIITKKNCRYQVKG